MRDSAKRKLVAVALGFVLGSVIVAAAFGIPAFRAHLQKEREWNLRREQLSRIDEQFQQDGKTATTPTPH